MNDIKMKWPFVGMPTYLLYQQRPFTNICGKKLLIKVNLLE